MEKHKCADCGLLAARNSQTRELEEVQGEYRTTGRAPTWSVEVPRRTPEIFSPFMGVGTQGLSDPLCFVRACDLASELKSETGSSSEKCLRIFGKERGCNSFTEWQQGFTPKEHREMMDRERFEERQERREEADRRWRSRQDLKLVLIAGFFTILGAVLAYLLGGR